MKKTFAAALLSVAVATPAFADSGFYIGGTLGSAKTNNFGTAVLTKSSDTVYGGLVGYQFNQNFGVEAQYTGAGKFSTATMSGKSDVLGVTAIGTLPLADNFSVYGKLGIARSKTKISDTTLTYQGTSRTAATYGVGVQYNATAQLGVRVGWDRYGSAVKTNTGASNNFNSNVLSVGVVYAF